MTGFTAVMTAILTSPKTLENPNLGDSRGWVVTL